MTKFKVGDIVYSISRRLSLPYKVIRVDVNTIDVISAGSCVYADRSASGFGLWPMDVHHRDLTKTICNETINS